MQEDDPEDLKISEALTSLSALLAQERIKISFRNGESSGSVLK